MTEFKIFVLGASGSGKTTLLASMYRQLAIQHREVGFYMQADDAQRVLLNQKYRQIANPTADWPPGTMDVETWTFTCSHNSGSMVIPLFSFQYLDYGGGRLAEHYVDGALTPTEEAGQADVAIVLIDGSKVFEDMRQNSAWGFGGLWEDLDHLLPLLMAVRCTSLQFLITKWDVLEPHYSLRQVRERLLEHPRFRAAVEHRREAGVRLIPVSAVGRGFAQLNAAGVMVKVPGAPPPHPFNIELSISCALVDVFREVLDSLEQEARAIVIKQDSRGARWAGRLSGASAALQTLLRDQLVPAPYNWFVSGLGALVSYADKKVKKRREMLERVLQEDVDQVSGRQVVIEDILIRQGLLLHAFEQEFPESDLTRI